MEIRKTKQNRIADDTLSSSRTLGMRIFLFLIHGDMLIVVVVLAPLAGCGYKTTLIDFFNIEV